MQRAGSRGAGVGGGRRAPALTPELAAWDSARAEGCWAAFAEVEVRNAGGGSSADSVSQAKPWVRCRLGPKPTGPGGRPPPLCRHPHPRWRPSCCPTPFCQPWSCPWPPRLEAPVASRWRPRGQGHDCPRRDVVSVGPVEASDPALRPPPRPHGRAPRTPWAVTWAHRGSCLIGPHSAPHYTVRPETRGLFPCPRETLSI